jgi:pimeloyl-ACP methyl ester carboxylesterase
MGCSALQRKFLFYPSHHGSNNGLTPWRLGDRIIGYAREESAPENVWLMLHGNGGQAADRTYAIPCFSPRDSVYIMEYPGYGLRPGKPSKTSFDTAAVEAYRLLRETFPQTPVCVVGESLGSGPSSVLASQNPAPDKIVLVVPFEKLTRVAADHFRFLPVGLILGKSWDNGRALSTYKGPIEIFGAERDQVIPIKHAQALAASLPSATFHLIEKGHNDWSEKGRVTIRNP